MRIILAFIWWAVSQWILQIPLCCWILGIKNTLYQKFPSHYPSIYTDWWKWMIRKKDQFQNKKMEVTYGWYHPTWMGYATWRVQVSIESASNLTKLIWFRVIWLYNVIIYLLYTFTLLNISIIVHQPIMII